MTSSYGERRNRPYPETFRSDSVSRFYKTTSTMVKQIQQHRPNVLTNPDRSCTYLVLRAHSYELSIQLKPNLEFPRGGAAQGSSLDQHSEEHWPGGGKIMMTLRSATPKGKEKARWRMVKPMLGIAGRVLFKVNCQGIPIITQPRKERKIREHNTDMTETRAARVEQNTRHRAELPTLYQVYICIN